MKVFLDSSRRAFWALILSTSDMLSRLSLCSSSPFLVVWSVDTAVLAILFSTTSTVPPSPSWATWIFETALSAMLPSLIFTFAIWIVSFPFGIMLSLVSPVFIASSFVTDFVLLSIIRDPFLRIVEASKILSGTSFSKVMELSKSFSSISSFSPISTLSKTSPVLTAAFSPNSTEEIDVSSKEISSRLTSSSLSTLAWRVDSWPRVFWKVFARILEQNFLFPSCGPWFKKKRSSKAIHWVEPTWTLHAIRFDSFFSEYPSMMLSKFEIFCINAFPNALLYFTHFPKINLSSDSESVMEYATSPPTKFSIGTFLSSSELRESRLNFWFSSISSSTVFSPDWYCTLSSTSKIGDKLSFAATLGLSRSDCLVKIVIPSISATSASFHSLGRVPSAQYFFGLTNFFTVLSLWLPFLLEFSSSRRICFEKASAFS